MKVDIFTLCDGVFSYEDKLTIVGVHDTLTLFNLTATPVNINIAAHLLFESDECGENTIRIYAEETENGAIILDLRDRLAISRRESHGTGTLNVALMGIPVLFPKTGIYRFTIEVEGRGSAHTLLNVRSHT